MNNERRKRINAVAAKLSDLFNEIENLKSEIEEIKDEEQDTLDNMPESFQQGERGEIAQAAIDNLEYAVDGLDSFDDVISYLESAAE